MIRPRNLQARFDTALIPDTQHKLLIRADWVDEDGPPASGPWLMTVAMAEAAVLRLQEIIALAKKITDDEH